MRKDKYIIQLAEEQMHIFIRVMLELTNYIIKRNIDMTDYIIKLYPSHYLSTVHTELLQSGLHLPYLQVDICDF